MGKRKKFERRRSSNSDTEDRTRKQSKINSNFDNSISGVISRANNILYDRKTDNPTETTETSETPPVEMAASNHANSGTNELREEMRLVLSTVKEIKSGQDSMRKSFDSKLDKMRNEFMATLDGKIKTLRDELAMDLSKESGRIDMLEKTLHTIQDRLDSVEQTGNQDGANIKNNGNLNQPEVCVTASNVPFDEGENLLEKALGIIRALGEDVSTDVVITNAKRLQPRYKGKPGLVKISFQNTEQKIKVLRNKHTLKDSDTYKRVIIKSDKTYAERLIESNAKTLLRHLPDGNNFRVDANGRIRERQTAGQEHQAGQ